MFIQKLKELIAQKGITKNKLLTDLGLGKNSFINWETRGTVPSGETLSRIADYFGVSVDYLLGNAEKEKPSEEGSGGEDVVVVNRSGKRFVHHLSPEQLDILSGMIEQMEKNNQ